MFVRYITGYANENTLEADTGTVAEVRDAARATGGASIGSGQNIIAQVPGPNCFVVTRGLGAIGKRIVAGCPTSRHIAIIWRQSLTGGEIQIQVLRHPTVAIFELGYPILLSVSSIR